MHHLWFGATGKPCWVTQKTTSMYKGHFKVSGKLKVASVQAKSEAMFYCFSMQDPTWDGRVGAYRPLL
jgi:hypothetical protein